MELNFTELNNLGNETNDNYDGNKYQNINKTTTENYWERTKSEKKKKVSFDDILSNMNLVVNQNGVLQYMTPLQSQDPYQESHQGPYQHNESRNAPLEPVVKHSYIFNKYFKDYKDSHIQTAPEPIIPKTIEEYRQLVLEDRIRRIQERNRISQIKSTQILFENSGKIQASKNSLRKMSFR